MTTDTDLDQNISMPATIIIMAATVVSTASIVVGTAHAFAVYPVATGAVVAAGFAFHALAERRWSSTV